MLILFLLTLALHAFAAPTDAPSAASFYVPSIPSIIQDPERPLTIFAGHLSSEYNLTRLHTNEVTPHLYFVLIKNRRTADRERIIFWFNGGPGCSSFDGLMMEVGPWRYDSNAGGFHVQEGGWEEYATMVYVDQPAGTGFSFTSTDRYVHTMEEAQKQFLEFLRQFYDVFPEYKQMDTYFAGESFAGQWIPYFADTVLNSEIGTPLKGIAIGNGWIDAKTHYASYIDFAVKVGMLEENSAAWKEAKKATDSCMETAEKYIDHPTNVRECGNLLLDVTKVRKKEKDGKATCVNIYDVRLDDDEPACGMQWPPDIFYITAYLARRDVVSALHATKRPGTWVECRGDVHHAFHEEDPASVTILPKVLEKIPVLLFAGDQDIICNYLGIEALIKDMTWNGQTGLGTVQTQSWTVNSMPAGTWVESRNLTYVKIFNASHMAPYDVPHVTHDMMLRFMDVNFSAIVDGSARIPSSIGSLAKPIYVEETERPTNKVPPAKTPEQDKAMWEAYYNAGSAALVLILVLLVIGTFVWCRLKRKRVQLPTGGNSLHMDEESIPLNLSMHGNENGTGRGEDFDDGVHSDTQHDKTNKGKDRAVVFDVGSDGEESEPPSARREHR